MSSFFYVLYLLYSLGILYRTGRGCAFLVKRAEGPWADAASGVSQKQHQILSPLFEIRSLDFEISCSPDPGPRKSKVFFFPAKLLLGGGRESSCGSKPQSRPTLLHLHECPKRKPVCRVQSSNCCKLGHPGTLPPSLPSV